MAIDAEALGQDRETGTAAQTADAPLPPDRPAELGPSGVPSVSISQADLAAIATTLLNEVGAGGLRDYNNVRGVTDSVINRTALGPEYSPQYGTTIQGTVNAPGAYSGITQSGGWINVQSEQTPADIQAAQQAVEQRLAEIRLSGHTSGVVDFANPRVATNPGSFPYSISPATIDAVRALTAHQFYAGEVPGAPGGHVYGLRPGSVGITEVHLALDPDIDLNWEMAAAGDSPSETSGFGKSFRADDADIYGYGMPGPSFFSGDPSLNFSTGNVGTSAFGQPWGGAQPWNGIAGFQDVAPVASAVPERASSYPDEYQAADTGFYPDEYQAAATGSYPDEYQASATYGSYPEYDAASIGGPYPDEYQAAATDSYPDYQAGATGGGFSASGSGAASRFGDNPLSSDFNTGLFTVDVSPSIDGLNLAEVVNPGSAWGDYDSPSERNGSGRFDVGGFGGYAEPSPDASFRDSPSSPTVASTGGTTPMFGGGSSAAAADYWSRESPTPGVDAVLGRAFNGVWDFFNGAADAAPAAPTVSSSGTYPDEYQTTAIGSPWGYSLDGALLGGADYDFAAPQASVGGFNVAAGPGSFGSYGLGPMGSGWGYGLDGATTAGLDFDYAAPASPAFGGALDVASGGMTAGGSPWGYDLAGATLDAGFNPDFGINATGSIGGLGGLGGMAMTSPGGWGYDLGGATLEGFSPEFGSAAPSWDYGLDGALLGGGDFDFGGGPAATGGGWDYGLDGATLDGFSADFGSGFGGDFGGDFENVGRADWPLDGVGPPSMEGVLGNALGPDPGTQMGTVSGMAPAGMDPASMASVMGAMMSNDPEASLSSLADAMSMASNPNAGFPGAVLGAMGFGADGGSADGAGDPSGGNAGNPSGAGGTGTPGTGGDSGNAAGGGGPAGAAGSGTDGSSAGGPGDAAGGSDGTGTGGAGAPGTGGDSGGAGDGPGW